VRDEIDAAEPNPEKARKEIEITYGLVRTESNSHKKLQTISLK
jgi:hypothetical protein